MFINSSAAIESVTPKYMRFMFENFSPLNDHYKEAFRIHTAFGVVCDYYDGQWCGRTVMKRLARAIDAAYDAKSLSVCSEALGKLDGVYDGKELISQCYLSERGESVPFDVYQLMFDCGFISQDRYDDALYEALVQP